MMELKLDEANCLITIGVIMHVVQGRQCNFKPKPITCWKSEAWKDGNGPMKCLALVMINKNVFMKGGLSAQAIS